MRAASSLPAAAATRLPIRVYWEDTDAGGVVYYASYLRFFERARTEWLRALGIEQQRLLEAGGVLFVVGEANLRYLAPARLDDRLEVTAALTELGRATIAFAQQAWRADTLLCEARVRIASVDAATHRPRRIPDAVARALSR